MLVTLCCRRAAVAVAVIAVAAVPACAPLEPVDKSPAAVEVSAPSGPPLEATLPDTFQPGTLWSTEFDSDDVEVSEIGIVGVLDGAEADSYRISAVDPTDGSTQWTSRAISSVEAPSVAWTEAQGQFWAIVVTPEGDAGVRVRAYNGRAGTTRTEPTSERVFVPAEGSDSRPTVNVGESGVLVRGTEDGSVRFLPQSGEATVYVPGPARDGEAGAPVEVFRDGWLLTYPEGGFAFASVAGGWESTDLAPTGVDPEGGSVLIAENGLLVADWGDGVVALHDMVTGQVLADARGVYVDLSSRPSGTTVSDSADGRWVSWWMLAFDLDEGTGSQAAPTNVNATAVREGVLYAAGAEASINGAALDLIVHEPVGVEPDVVPVAFTASGHGIFLTAGSTHGAVRVSSVPLR